MGKKKDKHKLPEPLETQRNYVLCGPVVNTHVSVRQPQPPPAGATRARSRRARRSYTNHAPLARPRRRPPLRRPASTCRWAWTTRGTTSSGCSTAASRCAKQRMLRVRAVACSRVRAHVVAGRLMAASAAAGRKHAHRQRQRKQQRHQRRQAGRSRGRILRAHALAAPAGADVTQ